MRSNTTDEYKAIVLDMEPRVPCVVTEAEDLNHISSYPVFVQPKAQGLSIVIRSGLAHIVKYPHVIYNYEFKNQFKKLFDESRRIKATVHCTLSSDFLDSDELCEILVSKDIKRLLPEDAKIYLEDLIFERVANQLSLLTRLANLEYIIYRNTKSESIKFYKAVPAINRVELDNLVSLWTEINEFEGVFIHESNSLYQEGESDLDDSNTIIYKPTKIYKGKLRSIECIDAHMLEKTVKHLVQMNVDFTDKNGVSHCIPVNVSNLSAAQRVAIADNFSDFKGRTVEFKAFNSVKCQLPTRRDFVRFSL